MGLCICRPYKLTLIGNHQHSLKPVSMQFSGLNKIHSQLTAYTGQSVHAVS